MISKSTDSEKIVFNLNVVLVGLSGVGKSAAGNIILGRKEFESGISSSSLTLKSEAKEGEVCGKLVNVVDTPGLFNTELSGERLREEMKRGVSLCEPGPHAFLLVVQLGRFTKQERKVMEEIQKLFSKRVKQYTMVLFSYGDRLGNTTIEGFISKDTNLQKLLEKCGGRYHVFNNKDMENRSQVLELLQKINKMVAENGGRFYTKDEINYLKVLKTACCIAAGAVAGGTVGSVAGSGGGTATVVGMGIGAASAAAAAAAAGPAGPAGVLVVAVVAAALVKWMCGRCTTKLSPASAAI